MTNANKEWRAIEEAPAYEVSNYGDVRRVKTKHELKGSVDKDGYPRVNIVNPDGKTLTRFRHRLAAQAFLPNPSNLPQVNHKDEDKKNAYVGCAEQNYEDGNLEWCTHTYNVNYGTGTARRVATRKETMKREARERATVNPTVFAYDANTHEFVGAYDNPNHAATELHCDYWTLTKCLNGERNHHHGMIFTRVPLS